MRVGIIGGGTIARLFLEHIQRGELGDARVCRDRRTQRPLARQAARSGVREFPS